MAHFAAFLDSRFRGNDAVRVFHIFRTALKVPPGFSPYTGTGTGKARFFHNRNVGSAWLMV